MTTVKATKSGGFAFYSRFWILFVIVLISDQASKLWILKNIEPLTQYPESGYVIIENFLYIIHVYNEGAAWGMFSGYGSVLAIIGIAALFFIYFMRQHFGLYYKSVQTAFGLLCGGIVGNIIDRLAYGHVVDFIDVHLPGYRWPTFNIADSGITIGVAIYIIINFLPTRQETPNVKNKE